MAVNNTKKTNSIPRTKKKRKPKKSKNIFKRLFSVLLFCFLAVFVIAAGYTFAIIKTTPPIDVEEVLSLNQASSLYDSNENFMDTLHTTEERYVVDSSKMPSNLKNAFVSIEDERFYKHNGVDVQRIIGAAILDVKKMITGQKGLQGASTLTQQLVKNTVLTNEFSLNRKIKEAYLSINLEKKLSKDEILTAYLNTIPLGGQVYGVQAASLLYFSKNVSDLSLIECAYIAGITQAPTYYSAYNENNKKDPSRYITRTITVLTKMNELGYITTDEYNKAVSSVNNGGLVFKARKQDYRLKYEWFDYPAVSQVKEDLKAKYKYTDEEVSKLMINGGLKIYTTMNKDLQDFTQATLDNYSNLGIGNAETYDADGVPLLQASATIMNYKTGEVLAMVGGRGKQQPQSTNRAYDALRSIGSSTKPLTVYGPGIDQKLITAASTIDDAPLPPEIGNKYPDGGKPYNPLNTPNEYLGNITAREAVTYSKNVASVITEDKIGLKTGLSYGENLGLTYSSKSKYIPTLALGQFYNDPNEKDGGNTYILSGAFGTFGNNGLYTKPMLYKKVVDASGKVLLENNKPIQKQVFSPQTAYIMYDILKGPVAYYGGKPAKWGEMPVAGKTGTTTDSTDLWFSGLTPYLSGSVWVGYDKPTRLMGTSSGCAAIWGKLMAKAHEGLEIKDIEQPNGIVKVEVCKDSGMLPTDLCKQDPRGNRVYEEMFIEGTEPTNHCNAHVLANVNKLNNKLATPGTPAFLTQSRIFVKKANPNPITSDYPYALPLNYDNDNENTESKTNINNTQHNNKNNSSNSNNNSNSNSNSNSSNNNNNTNQNDNANNNSNNNNSPVEDNNDSHNNESSGGSIFDKLFKSNN